MRRLFPIVLLLLGAAPVPASVSYELAPEFADGAITALRVTARFVGDRDGVTTFDWIDSWAGERKLGQWSRDLAVTGATAIEPAPHGGRIIHAAPGAPITVTYRIVSAFAADPSVDDSRQPRPVVRPGWFYGVGESLFAIPEGRDAAPLLFSWTGPAGIGFASDLEHRSSSPRRSGKTLADLTESVVIGGRDLRVTAVTAGGAPLRIATVGRYGFDIAAFDQLAAGVVDAERRFWGDTDRQPFLITMTPETSQPGRLSYSGTGRADAFALWMDQGAPLSNLAWLLGHEFFHSWNPRRLGALGSGEEEKRRYWFSEGFTDFYARRLMLRAKLMTPDEFATSWNETLAAYAASPYRTASNAAAAAKFWDDRQAEKLPYQRGAMMAAWWDARARASGGLDPILRDQRRHARGDRAVTELFATVAAAHGLDVRPDIARHLERGEAIVLPRDAFGACAAVETITRPVFARGYDSAATTKAGVVAGVDPASPAYVAGLRDGMTLLKRTGGTPGDARVDYVLLVRDGGAERTITFKPAGRAMETLQQIVLDRARFAATPATCAASLAG